MTRKDYEILKSWGDLHPERPHLPEVGSRVCLACLRPPLPPQQQAEYGAIAFHQWTAVHKKKKRCHYKSPAAPFIEGYPTFQCKDNFCRCPSSNRIIFKKKSHGDRFYATLRALGYVKNPVTGNYQ